MRKGKGGLEERARAKGKREKGRCAREGLIILLPTEDLTVPSRLRVCERGDRRAIIASVREGLGGREGKGEIELS